MNWKQPIVYAVKHKNDSVIAASRSGGIFTAISDWVLAKNGILYGCVLDESFHAIHIRTESAQDRNRMRGSKYIQSKLGDTYKNVKQDLIDGKLVLFTGTSCQVAGLKQYLEKEYENLLCVDIVCHGVPSPKAWKAYLIWQEEKNKSKIKAVDFRNKKDYGWREHIETLYFENGNSISSKIFTYLFFEHSILRPCCYECPYKSVIHPGDITIADYWGIEKAAPEFDDNKGVSLVLVNNEFGQKAFDDIKDMLKYKKTKIEDSMQPSLIAPVERPSQREAFWRDFENQDFDFIVKKYSGIGIVNKIKRLLKRIKRKLVG